MAMVFPVLNLTPDVLFACLVVSAFGRNHAEPSLRIQLLGDLIVPANRFGTSGISFRVPSQPKFLL